LPSSRWLSHTSQTAAMRTSGTLTSDFMRKRARPPVPITPTRSASLAPRTRPVATADAATAAEVFRKERRETVMRASPAILRVEIVCFAPCASALAGASGWCGRHDPHTSPTRQRGNGLAQPQPLQLVRRNRRRAPGGRGDAGGEAVRERRRLAEGAP